MSERSESDLIREVREVLARGELTEKVTVDYRVSLGMPSEEVEAFTSSGGIPVRLRLVGDGQLTAPHQTSVQLDPLETRQLLEQIASSLVSMVPRAQVLEGSWGANRPLPAIREKNLLANQESARATGQSRNQP